MNKRSSIADGAVAAGSKSKLTMKRGQIYLILSFALLFSMPGWAQNYTFLNINSPGDPNNPFTQLLGINNNMVIAGYHNFNQNQGFTLVLPNVFTSENFPNSVMTQVIGISNDLTTDGFYVDQAGRTHGFFRVPEGRFTTVDYPAATNA